MKAYISYTPESVIDEAELMTGDALNMASMLESYGQRVADAVRLEFPDMTFVIKCGNENTVRVSDGSYDENRETERAIDHIMDAIWLSLDHENYN